MNEDIRLINPYSKQSLKSSASGLVDDSGATFPKVDGVYRFVDKSNYANSFGFQWNKFQQTQIDRYHKGSSQSAERFFAATGWQKNSLEGQYILEVGSGAGRFTRVILESTKADLFSVDFSDAVDANMRNNGPNARLDIFQASIYALPFESAQFDKVICFGVLQHTPDFRGALKCLIDMVKPGGELIVDFYPVKGWYTKIHAKYLFRPITKRMSHDKLLRVIENNIDRLIGLYRLFEKFGLGRILNRFVPICDITNTLPRQLSKAELREWVILDTFDMFSPQYDNPQRLETVVKWTKEYGMNDVKGLVVRYGEENNSIHIVKAVK